jgi:hypothetical protein
MSTRAVPIRQRLGFHITVRMYGPGIFGDPELRVNELSDDRPGLAEKINPHPIPRCTQLLVPLSCDLNAIVETG